MNLTIEEFELLNKNSWVAELICEVAYHGSAIGKLISGSYLVIRKPDNSISIQAGDKNLPRNYLRALKISTDLQHCKIVCSNKKEQLTINIQEIRWIQQTKLSLNTVVITNSEKQLVDKFISTIGTFITGANETNTFREYQLEGNGKVDIITFLDGVTWIIEAKRKKVTQKCIAQVLQYKHHAPPGNITLAIIGPDISKNASAYAERTGVKFIQFSH